jgi:hypothetical protein
MPAQVPAETRTRCRTHCTNFGSMHQHRIIRAQLSDFGAIVRNPDAAVQTVQDALTAQVARSSLEMSSAVARSRASSGPRSEARS